MFFPLTKNIYNQTSNSCQYIRVHKNLVTVLTVVLKERFLTHAQLQFYRMKTVPTLLCGSETVGEFTVRNSCGNNIFEIGKRPYCNLSN